MLLILYIMYNNLITHHLTNQKLESEVNVKGKLLQILSAIMFPLSASVMS